MEAAGHEPHAAVGRARHPEELKGTSGSPEHGDLAYLPLLHRGFFLAAHPRQVDHVLQLLSHDLDLQGRVRQEAVAGGGAPDLDALPYIRAVVQESMRLLPPIWMIERRAAVEDTTDGYRIPAGSVIALSQYVTHRTQPSGPTRSASTPTGSGPTGRPAGPVPPTFPSAPARGRVSARGSPPRPS